MLYPAIIKRIASRIKGAYMTMLIEKEYTVHYKDYSSWMQSFLELSESDVNYTINTFEKYQTKSIIEAMGRKDKEIFINQLGCFYIKPTTMVFYNKLNEITEGKARKDIDFKAAKEIALQAAKDEYMRIAELKKEIRNGKAGKLEI
jgi:hypothetical protein